MSKPKDKPAKFEDAVEQLESIIEQIESGQAGLEESIDLYERGMKLIGQCRGILASAEKKIAELNVNEKGKLAETDQGASEDE